MKLGFLRRLYAGDPVPDGPGYASMYLDTSPDEATQTEVGLRWRAARDRLVSEGADEATVEAVAQQVTAVPPHSPGLAVFARDGAVRLVRALPWRPRDEVSRYAPLPHITPLLQHLATDAPHVRVSATRKGARLLLCPPDDGTGADRGDQALTVKGETWPVHQVSRGGWSEYNLQRSAEAAWAENAKRIAEATTQAVQATSAAFVLVGGDQPERGLVLDALPEAVGKIAVRVEQEEDPEAAAFDTAAAAESARLEAAELSSRLDDFRARIKRPDPGDRRAVEGLDATLAALRAGLADTVLLGFDPASVPTVWIGAEPTAIAVSVAELRQLGVDNPVAVRGDAAVARAVCLTDAELFFLPEQEKPPVDGIAALLRAPATAV